MDDQQDDLTRAIFSRRRTPEKREEDRRLFTQGLSVGEIARRRGMSKSAVRKDLKRTGILNVSLTPAKLERERQVVEEVLHRFSMALTAPAEVGRAEDDYQKALGKLRAALADARAARKRLREARMNISAV